MKLISYIFLFATLGFNIKAQNFETDMKLVYDDFIQSEKVAFNISYVLRENHNLDSRIIHTNIGKYIKLKNKFISVYDTKSTLVLPSEIIMIDKEDKKIRVKKVKQKENINPDFMTQLKSYNGYISKVVALKTNKENVLTYNVELKSNAPFPISKYEISIDTKKHYLVQMSLFYKKPLEKDEDYKITGKEIPRLDIIFSDINNSSLFSIVEFEEAYYFLKKNSKLSPSQNFKDYDVKETL